VDQILPNFDPFKTTIEKHQKLRKRTINQLFVNYLPPQKKIEFEN
jgi:hypothetical protein